MNMQMPYYNQQIQEMRNVLETKRKQKAEAEQLLAKLTSEPLPQPPRDLD